MKVAFTKLSMIFIGVIVSGFLILTLDQPRFFDLSYTNIKNRTISVGTSEDVSDSIRIRHFVTWYTVQEAGNAKVWTEFVFDNISNKTVSSNLIFILPNDVTIDYSALDGSGMQATHIESRDFAKVVYLPFTINKGNVEIARVNFDWPTFAQQSRFKQWEFYVAARTYHPEFGGEGNGFFQLKQANATAGSIIFIQQVALDPESYRVIDYHPSSAALDYPKMVLWNVTKANFDFAINGSYADIGAREWLEPLRQLAFYLPISGFVGLPIEYFRQKKRNNERSRSDD